MGVPVETAPPLTESESPPSTPVDSLAELLEDPHRRAALTCLARRRAPAGLYALAGQILESLGSNRADGSAVDVERLAIAIHHSHLPRLADSGLVEYDVDRRTVRAQRAADTVPESPDRTESMESLLERWRCAGDSVDHLR